MGRKLSWAFAIVSVPIILLLIVSLCLPLWTGTELKYFVKATKTIEIYVFHVVERYSNGEVQRRSIQAYADSWCVGVSDLVHNWCDKVQQAFAFGLVLLLCCLLTIIGQGVSLWFLWIYMYEKPAPRYRAIITAITASGFGVMLVAIVLYGFAVINELNEADLNIGSVLKHNQSGVGIGNGYILLILAVIFMFVQLVFSCFIKGGDESRYERIKERMSSDSDSDSYEMRAAEYDFSAPIAPIAPAYVGATTPLGLAYLDPGASGGYMGESGYIGGYTGGYTGGYAPGYTGAMAPASNPAW